MQLVPKDERGDELFSAYTVAVNVINQGETTEFVSQVWVENPVSGEGVDYSPSPDVELKPHARWSTTINALTDFADFPGHRFAAVLILANGLRIETPVEEMMHEMIEEAETDADSF